MARELREVVRKQRLGAGLAMRLEGGFGGLKGGLGGMYVLCNSGGLDA
jgi:hypothetical protein